MMEHVIPKAIGPTFRRFLSSRGEHILVVPYSRIFDLPAEWKSDSGDLTPEAHRMIEALALPTTGEASLDLVPIPPTRSISLNVSASCNLACSYCYASQGGFEGKQVGAMDWSVARVAVDRLLDDLNPGERATIGFLGGEPFVNRSLIRRVVDYAANKADRRGLWVQFSITTNGTLIDEYAREMLRQHRFAVTISIDGAKAVQDRQRPFHNQNVRDRSSWTELEACVSPLLASPGKALIGARATVTRSTLSLGHSFEEIAKLGFKDVGFSPLRQAPGGHQGLTDEDWPRYVFELTQLAQSELRRAIEGKSIRLTNFAIAMRHLHRGWASPFSCGAGGGYFSVASDGKWYACHRAIGEKAYLMGDNNHLDNGARRTFLMTRHVHAQTDCSQCWARYLCSGGCHQEAKGKSIASCNFIRSWLDHCLAAYCELSAERPEWFDVPSNSEVLHVNEG